jgi:hypothetical protein
MKPVFIPGAGMFISAEVCADLRHGARRDLREAQRNQEHVAAHTVAAVELMDTIGAAWVNKKVSHVSPGVSQVDAPRCEAINRTPMTVSAAAAELKISPQATRKLLERGTLHGERGPREWRVCAESVAARKESTCQH